MRPTWEQTPSSAWQPTSPPREIPPPPQRSGFSATTWAVIVAVVVVLLGAGGYYLFGSSGTGFDVTVTSCAANGSVATVGLDVHNKGRSSQTATIRVEYRDNAGKLLTTDTALVRDVGGGDTAHVEQSTILDADSTSGLTCKVTGAA